jgi:hypothetical protein
MGPILLLAGTALIILAFLAQRVRRLERRAIVALTNEPAPALRLHQPVDSDLSPAPHINAARRHTTRSAMQGALRTPRQVRADYSAALQGLERHLQRVEGDLEQRLPEQLSLLDHLIEAGDREIQALQLRLAEPTTALSASLPAANRQPDLLLGAFPADGGDFDQEDNCVRSLPFEPQPGKEIRRKAA